MSTPRKFTRHREAQAIVAGLCDGGLGVWPAMEQWLVLMLLFGSRSDPCAIVPTAAPAVPKSVDAEVNFNFSENLRPFQQAAACGQQAEAKYLAWRIVDTLRACGVPVEAYVSDKIVLVRIKDVTDTISLRVDMVLAQLDKTDPHGL